jgi:hypothetical protein
MMREVGFSPSTRDHHVFRKFLLFISCLLTFASQNGYASIDIESPKAVLQRGSYTKVNVSFILANFGPEDLQRYGMPAVDPTTDSGIQSLTRFLNVCVFEESGKKCTEGPNVDKVRYITNSALDTTPQDQFSDDYLVGFINGSPRFDRLESDLSGTFRNIFVSMEITTTATKPFSTDTVIALHLLPGTNAPSTDIREAEIKPTLAVAIDDVIDSLTIRPSKKTLTATWNEDEQLNLAKGGMGPADGVIAFVVPRDLWNTPNIPLRTYNEADPGAEEKIPNACKITSTDNECTVDCSAASGADSYYIKSEDVTNPEFKLTTAGNTGNVSITDLENNATYALVIQAQPDGLKRSCFVGAPSDAVTLSELGGGPEPKVKDPRCFIATAAYGSPLDPHLNTLRWFRDHVLLVTDFGQDMVQFYYRVSPPLADFIAARPTLRTVTRGALWLPVIVIEFWRERPSLLLTLSAMASTFLLLFLRRRSLRASV